MAYGIAAPSLVSVGSNTAQLLAGAVASGTAPITYAWYRSTSTGFTVGSGNIIAGATGATLNDSGIIPGTGYFYKTVATDSSATPQVATSAQLAVTTLAPSQSQNQFSQAPFLGMLDLRFNNDTVAVEIDSSQATGIYAGQAVKIVDSSDGIPKVVAVSAITDEVFGFINFDVKTQLFVAGSKAEISQSGNVIYLYATTAISRGVQVTIDITSPGGVSAAVSTANIVGYAYDKASAPGQLIRVKLKTPSFAFAP